MKESHSSFSPLHVKAITLLLFSAFILPAYYLVLPPAAQSVSTTVVISEFRVRGPNGANDEFIELYNLSASPIDISGWKIKGSNSAGTTSTRATIPAGTTLPSGCHYLLTNSSTSGGPYSGSVPGDQTYTIGITDDGGIAVTLADDTIVDQVGMNNGSAFKEGTPLASLGTSNLNRGYERKPGGTSGSGTDTDNNATDFQLIAPSDPQNLASACLPADLSITKTATPNPVTAGSNITYTLVVSNVGPSTAMNVTVTDPQPANTTVVSCLSTGGGVCGSSGSNITISFASIPAGGAATITLVATVNCSVSSGTIINNTATVTSSTTDPNTDNNSSLPTATTVNNPSPTISCPSKMTVDSDPNQPGAKVNYMVTATDNCAPSPSVSCTPPSGGFYPVGLTPVTCTATDLAGGTFSCDFTIAVRAPITRSAAVSAALDGAPEKTDPSVESAEQQVVNRGLLIAEFANDQVRVLRNQGDGTFRTRQVIPVGDGPNAIAMGDLNRDGHVDSVVANQLSNTLDILLGNGDGTFRGFRSIPVGHKPSAVAIGDFTGDTIPDLVVAHFADQNVWLLKGRGDGTFDPTMEFAVGKEPTGITVSDLDQDGLLDAAICNFGSDDVTILKGHNKRFFQPAAPVPVGEGPMSITQGDFDRDGSLELVTVNFKSHDLTILKSRGPRGFTVAQQLTVGEGPVGVVTGTWLTGRLGIAVANLVSGEVTLYLGEKNDELRTLRRALPVTSAVSIVVADFNNDGRVDLGVLEADGVTFRVLLDHGDGTFRLVTR